MVSVKNLILFLLFQKYIENIAKLAKPWTTCVWNQITILAKMNIFVRIFTPKPYAKWN